MKEKKGDNLSFNHILAISDGIKNTIGDPLVKGASIEAKILDQIRDKKIIVFKKKRRKNYRLTQGHRQYLTVLKIESILKDSQKTVKSTINKKLTKIKKEEKIQNKVSKKIDIKAENQPIVKKMATKKTVKKKQMLKKTVAKKTTKSKE